MVSHAPASGQSTSVSTQAEGQDRSAQADLLAAFNTAVTYYYDRSSYDGFTRKIATGYEPGLLWISARPAAPGMMSIDTAEGSSVNISTMSVSGQVFCIAGEGTTAVHGRTDGFTSDCSGGW